MTPDDLLLERAREFVGRDALPPAVACDPVNAPTIRRWCMAMGETDPIHLDDEAARRAGHAGVVAPLAMLDVWTMPPYRASGHDESGMAVLRLFDAAGFSGVVATNVEQRYARYLVDGDVVSARVVVAAVSDRKATAIGHGYFVTLAYDFTDSAGAAVGAMTFRVLKFRPAALAPTTTQATGGDVPARPRPAITHDNAFFWEGVRNRRLLFQRDAAGRWYHPPRPVVPGHFEPEIASAGGGGTIHSFVIVHQPRLPGFDYPLPVALVELDEGIRIVANLVEAPERIGIGDRVEAVFVETDGDPALAFRLETAAP
jgi:uncharacterized OB-fold protein/acyl dehydratase